MPSLGIELQAGPGTKLGPHCTADGCSLADSAGESLDARPNGSDNYAPARPETFMRLASGPYAISPQAVGTQCARTKSDKMLHRNRAPEAIEFRYFPATGRHAQSLACYGYRKGLP